MHHPREILRIERDYTGGEVIQFSPSYPLELEGRVRAVHSAYGVGPCANMHDIDSGNPDPVPGVHQFDQRGANFCT